MASGAFLAFSIITAVASNVQQRKAAKAQRKQNDVSNRIAANKRVRDVRRAIAAGRVRRAQTEAQGFALGVSGGSAVQGAVAGQTSDLASSIGASNQQFTGQQAISSLSNQISRAQQSAGTFSALSSIASNFVGGDGSVGAQNRDTVSNLFSPA